MKERLVDILMDVEGPALIIDDVQFGGWKLRKRQAELLADALIENGVTLPTFKVGDIIWVYDFMWGVIPCEVDKLYHCRCGKDGSCTFEMSFTEEDIGKYVFATKEKAEEVWCDRSIH